MQQIVTLRANRYHVKTVFNTVSVMVVKMLCLFRATHTLEIFYGVHFASFNSASYRRIRLDFFGIAALIFANSFYMHTLTTFTYSVLFNPLWVTCSKFASTHSFLLLPFFSLAVFLLVFFLIGTAFFSLAIRFFADFAIKTVSIFTRLVPVKLCEQFQLLTTRTCLASLNNHVLFLNKRQYPLTVFDYITNQILTQGELF